MRIAMLTIALFGLAVQQVAGQRAEPKRFQESFAKVGNGKLPENWGPNNGDVVVIEGKLVPAPKKGQRVTVSTPPLNISGGFNCKIEHELRGVSELHVLFHMAKAGQVDLDIKGRTLRFGGRDAVIGKKIPAGFVRAFNVEYRNNVLTVKTKDVPDAVLVQRGQADDTLERVAFQFKTVAGGVTNLRSIDIRPLAGGNANKGKVADPFKE